MFWPAQQALLLTLVPLLCPCFTIGFNRMHWLQGYHVHRLAADLRDMLITLKLQVRRLHMWSVAVMLYWAVDVLHRWSVKSASLTGMFT